jgi:hypothetical protein
MYTFHGSNLPHWTRSWAFWWLEIIVRDYRWWHPIVQQSENLQTRPFAQKSFNEFVTRGSHGQAVAAPSRRRKDTLFQWLLYEIFDIYYIICFFPYTILYITFQAVFSVDGKIIFFTIGWLSHWSSANDFCQPINQKISNIRSLYLTLECSHSPSIIQTYGLSYYRTSLKCHNAHFLKEDQRVKTVCKPPFPSKRKRMTFPVTYTLSIGNCN